MRQYIQSTAVTRRWSVHSHCNYHYFSVFIRFQGSEKGKVRISCLVAESDQLPIAIPGDLLATGIIRKKTAEHTGLYGLSWYIPAFRHLLQCCAEWYKYNKFWKSLSGALGSSHWESPEPSLRHIWPKWRRRIPSWWVNQVSSYRKISKGSRWDRNIHLEKWEMNIFRGYQKTEYKVYNKPKGR